MVQLMWSEKNFQPVAGNMLSSENQPVKLEIEDSLEVEEGPFHKRWKRSTDQQWSLGSNEFAVPPSQFNPLNEPSPLGLRLRKSPSLLELIQMRLSQGNSGVGSSLSEDLKSGNKKDVRANTAPGSLDKLKASNFSVSLLRIGRWEYVSRHEGDLVAKCYFAKHKLVWEVLDGGLKCKIEIQWSDIMALKAHYPANGPGTLTVVLNKQPLFFRETNPQPRKHTLWQATADFTDGQASRHRQHFLQCAQGVLNKHYEKLIQCDTRLNLLSQQSETVLDSPYFVPEASIFNDLDMSRDNGFNGLETANISLVSGFQGVASRSTFQPSSSKAEELSALGMAHEDLSKEAHSSNSGMSTRAIEGNTNTGRYGLQGLKHWPRLQPSMSISDLVNHIGHCTSEQRTSGHLPVPEKASDSQQNSLENIAQILLTDTQFTTASDEKTLMSRVNSLCSLLQDPSSGQIDGRKSNFNGKDGQSNSVPEKGVQGDVAQQEYHPSDVSLSKQVPGMSRKDSLADLLLQLPRIASLPKFLFDISEDGEILNP